MHATDTCERTIERPGVLYRLALLFCWNENNLKIDTSIINTHLIQRSSSPWSLDSYYSIRESIGIPDREDL